MYQCYGVCWGCEWCCENPNIWCYLGWQIYSWCFLYLQWAFQSNICCALCIQSCYTRWWIYQRLEGCGYAAKLTVCFSADSKLGTGKFYHHGCILGDALVLSFGVILGWIVAMWDAQSENLMDGDLSWSILNTVHQSVIKTVYFKLKLECVGICRNVGYYLVKLVNTT